VYPDIRRTRRERVVDGTVTVAVYAVAGAFCGGIILLGFVWGNPAPVIIGVAAALVWLVAIRMNLFKIASRIEFCDGVFAWRVSAPFSRRRSGRLRAVRFPAPGYRKYVAFETVDGKTVLVIPGVNLKRFIEQLGTADPGIVIDIRSGRTIRWLKGQLRRQSNTSAGKASTGPLD
jgi:hypothetical protein